MLFGAFIKPLVTRFFWYRAHKVHRLSVVDRSRAKNYYSCVRLIIPSSQQQRGQSKLTQATTISQSSEFVRFPAMDDLRASILAPTMIPLIFTRLIETPKDLWTMVWNAPGSDRLGHRLVRRPLC